MSAEVRSTVGEPALATRQHDGWLILSQEGPCGDPLRDMLGAPGLWRSLRGERVFELAPQVRETWEPEFEIWDADPGDGDRDDDLVGWGAETASGTALDRFYLPSAEDLEAWVPVEVRHVRAGGRLSPVEVVADESRLALVAPALVHIPEDLCQSRAAWLAELCHDAQERWRLVRFGIDDARACVSAEVDLTGAPPERARVLFQLALAALTASASWALPGLALCTDLSIESRMLGRIPRRETSRRNTPGSGHGQGEAR